MMRRYRITKIALVLGTLAAIVAYTNWAYSRLHAIRYDAEEKITTFSSDGCSGGLSSGWRWLSNAVPSFELRFGHAPPWEHCCYTHDLSYWLGGTTKERKESDLELRSCVKQLGYPIAGHLMYIGVRLGGIPCTGLPWRWGYGWRQC